MNDTLKQSASLSRERLIWSRPKHYAPFIHLPESSRNIYRVIFIAASLPLMAGIVIFGWRALIVTILSVAGCVITESAYYRITQTPAMHGRMHGAVTGLLLALTLPATVPWYVPITAAVFATIIGKALFGGMGHFLWQPALVGRLAVTVIFAPPLFNANLVAPEKWSVLAQNRIILGDVCKAKQIEIYHQWQGTPPPSDCDAFKLPRPRKILRKLTLSTDHPPESITSVILKMPPAEDLILGTHGGGIGETSAIIIILAGLYLIHRNYIRSYLPGMFMLAAAITAAVAPVRTGDGLWQWCPITAEGIETGFIYVAYHLASGELLLAGWLLATEMTSRPITASAQAIFGILCGAAAMLIRLYLDFPIPAYAAVLLGNTFTPLLDAAVRPRALKRTPHEFYEKI